MVIIEGLFTSHFFDGLVQHKTYRLACFAVVERERLLTGHVEEQIAFTDAAAENYLNGIAAAGIIFRNANHLLIIGKCQIQQVNCVQCSTIADSEAGANMAVKCGGFFPKYFLIHTKVPTCVGFISGNGIITGISI